MSNDYYKLRWNSADGQGEMPSGEFSSKAEAIANIAKAKAEHLAGCTSDKDRAGIEAGSFDVRYTGPEFIVENIEIENNEGSLFASFNVRQIDYKGDEVYSRGTGDWIDLDDGLLVASCSDESNMRHWPDGLSSNDLEAIHDIVNDHLRENPISAETLQRYRDVKDGYGGEKASEEDQEEFDFDVEIDGVTYSVSASNETAYVNGEDVIWFHLEDEHRHLGEKHVLAKDVEYYGYETAVTDRIRELYHSHDYAM